MPSAEERVRAINEERMKVWERAKEITDNAERDGGMTAADQENFRSAMGRIDEIDALREAILSSDKAKEDFQAVNETPRRATSPDERCDLERRDVQAEQEIRSLFRTGREEDAFNPAMRIDKLNIDLSVPAAYFNAMRQGVPFTELRTYQTDTGTT